MNKQAGAAMTEYAIGMLLVVVILIPVMIALALAANTRANESLSTVKNVSPCSDRLAQLGRPSVNGTPQSLEDPDLAADICN